MKILKVLVVFLFFILLLPRTAFGKETNQFITIVNPVRISKYTRDPGESLSAQYEVLAESNLPATWLLTYDAMVNEDVLSVIESMDEKQEMGVFLEVTPNLASAAKVDYNDTGFWHHATSVFLSGYNQEERKLLIDTLFEEFREKFGFYPVSVGSWWTDSFSLDYMKQKYNITGNLGVADQFSTDGYQVWGQYWSIPFYPSKYHTGIPATTKDVKLDLVNFQWAAREPLNGYESSLYSTQDYAVLGKGLEIEYFEKLINLFAKRHNNQFGQITVGLEGDLNPENYRENFREQMELVGKLAESEEFRITNMGEFSKWYRNRFPELSPSQIIESDDFLSKKLQKVFWYQTPKYRIGIVHNYETKETKIIDLRTYHADLQEPYYQTPNREFELSIYTPSYFDEINNPEDVWVVNFGEIASVEGDSKEFIINFNSGSKMVFTSDKFVLSNKQLEVPKIISESKTLSVRDNEKYIEIVPEKNWIGPRKGLTFRDLTSGATHFLATRRVKVFSGFAIVLFIVVNIGIIFSSLSDRKKTILLTILILPTIVFCQLWYQRNTTNYYISQGEIDALYRLSILPSGKVVVFDNECLQCSWHTEYRPAVFANKREYVKKYGKHPIIYNSSVFKAKIQKEAREEFEKLGAEYIYLSKYEDYIEKTPFSPGDLGIEKIYDNANGEIWKVVK